MSSKAGVPHSGGKKKAVNPNSDSSSKGKRPAAPIATGKESARKKQAVIFKCVFESPFHIKWPAPSRDDKTLIMERLKAVFATQRAAAIAKRGTGPPRPKRLYAAAAAASTESSQPDASIPLAWSSRLVVPGVNAITRGLETQGSDDKAPFCMVFVCKDADPPSLIQHLPALCFTRKVPLCALAETSEAIGAVFGLRSAMAVGLRACDPGAAHTSDTEAYEAMIQFVRARTPELSLPWLPQTGPTGMSAKDGTSLLPLVYTNVACVKGEKGEKKTAKSARGNDSIGSDRKQGAKQKSSQQQDKPQ